jgi:hypothetical protein
MTNVSKAEPQPVVLTRDRAKVTKWRVKDPEGLSTSLVVMIGAAFALVGLADLALVWTPPRFGNPTWEFGTLTQTFMNVPMTGLGLLLIAFGLIRHPRRGVIWVRVAAIVFTVLTLAIAVMGILYATVLPEILRQAPPEGLDALGRAMIKTVTEVIVYPLAFGTISLLLWKGLEKQQTP